MSCPPATMRTLTAHPGLSMFDDFLKTAWQRHADHPQDVYDGLTDGISTVKEPGQAGKMAALVVHVAGEHMGRWSDGQGLLSHMLTSDVDDPAGNKSIYRCKAILFHCSDEHEKRDEALIQGASDNPEGSDKVRILSTAASALLGQDRIEDAMSAFNEALANADYSPSAEDPASRALAIAGNNMAAALEERPNLEGPARELLKTAAHTARKFWEVAGNWLNVERAEYRLAMTHLALTDAALAREHAQNCLDICTENSADALEHFFAHEALAKAYHTGGNTNSAKVSRDFAAEQVPLAPENLRSWLAGELTKLDAHLA